MAKHEGVLPCPQCGNGTYTDDDEPGMIYCQESDMPVLACDATPIWKQQALAEAEAAQPGQDKPKSSRRATKAKDEEKEEANA
jgi:hypothetical protein